MRADGSNGWFCTGTYSNEGGGSGRASFFDPADHLVDFQSAGMSYEDVATEVLTHIGGLTSTETARVEVEWIDGTVPSVAPKNTSNRFPGVRFWTTGTSIDLEPGQSPESFDEAVVEVWAYDADGALLATSRSGVLTVE